MIITINIVWFSDKKSGGIWMNRTWNIVHDCDLEDGTATCWALKVADGTFYWINLVADGTFDIVDHDAKTVLKNCKSFASAKRWVTMNLL